MVQRNYIRRYRHRRTTNETKSNKGLRHRQQIKKN